jgi:dolichyl-diphosphooligosaccharide--protein glycosyltransferase/undecaprenyl-diphosphooligosaccharide--protein glycosyltransferase
MLNIVFPMFLLWSIILALDTKNDIYMAISAIVIALSSWWYPQSYSLTLAFFVLILLYTVIFDRKDLYNYKLLSIMMLSMISINIWIKLILIIVSFVVFMKKEFDKYLKYIFAASVLLFFATGGFSPIWAQLKNYIFTSSNVESSLKDGASLHFYAVIKTVREAAHIPFETFANRISGHTSIFILSTIGYLYLAFKHRVMLFALPLVGLGFVAIIGGLRFTVYAVPILAMGIAFLITEISSKAPSNKMKYALMSILTLGVLYPNYKHIDSYLVPTVFEKEEVKVLDKLKDIGTRDDYVLAWWDYGFPIRYYTDKKTIIDGAKHTGDQNFPVSYILMQPQKEAANMARLDVEYQEKRNNEDTNFNGSNIKQMAQDYGYKDINKFLATLNSDIKLPKKTTDVYLYLPYKMINIFPVISLFSNMDLMTGKEFQRPFLYMSSNFKEDKVSINLNRGIIFDKRNYTLKMGQNRVQLRRVIKTAYAKDASGKLKLQRSVQNINPRGELTLIYMSDYRTFLVVDEKAYRSTYIQLMILENYDKDLFELIISNPYAKVYKLKV